MDRLRNTSLSLPRADCKVLECNEHQERFDSRKNGNLRNQEVDGLEAPNILIPKIGGLKSGIFRVFWPLADYQTLNLCHFPLTNALHPPETDEKMSPVPLFILSPPYGISTANSKNDANNILFSSTPLKWDFLTFLEIKRPFEGYKGPFYGV